MHKPVSLQQGLLGLMERQLPLFPEFEEKEGWTDEERFQAFRLHKLRKTVALAYENSLFYKRLFDHEGIKPEDIQSFGDLKKIPFTEPSDLAARPYDFLCVSQGEIERIITFTSSGTIGPQKRVFFTTKDLDHITDFLAVGMNTATGKASTVQILLPDGPVMGQSDLLKRGVEKMGGTPVMSGLFAPSEEQVKAIRDNGSKVIFGETRLIYRISKEMEDTWDLAALGLDCVFVTTSYLPEAMRTYLEKAYDCRVSTHYGLSEMGLGLAVECPETGLYHFNELDTFGEVVDPETGKRVEPGQEGELVFTTLMREGMPLIRYRSHDLAALLEGPCACGSFLSSITHVKRRRESLVKLSGGETVYPSLFDDTLFRHPDVIDFNISLDRRGGRLVFDVEVKRDATAGPEELVPLIRKAAGTGALDVAARVLPQGSLKPEAHFKKMIKEV